MPAHATASAQHALTVTRAARRGAVHGGLTVVPTDALICMLRFAFDRDAHVRNKRAEHAVATLLRVSRVSSEMRRVVYEFATFVHSAAQTLHDTEHGLVCLMDANKNMHHVLLRHLRAVPDDLVGMDAFFELPEQYRASAQTPEYLHVRSWRVIDFEIMPIYYGHCARYTSVSKCICFNLPFKAPEGILRLEAVDISTPRNFVCNDEMPPVRLKMRGVPVQASLDDLSRLCFMQRTTCTVCCRREAKHESLQTCSKPKNKRRFAMLCDVCCKELFVLVQKCQSFHWQAPRWVLELEAKDELYFFSRVQERVGVFGHPKAPDCGIYALKHQSALAQGFDSWSALYMHQCDQKAAKRKARK